MMMKKIFLSIALLFAFQLAHANSATVLVSNNAMVGVTTSAAIATTSTAVIVPAVAPAAQFLAPILIRVAIQGGRYVVFQLIRIGAAWIIEALTPVPAGMTATVVGGIVMGEIMTIAITGVDVVATVYLVWQTTEWVVQNTDKIAEVANSVWDGTKWVAQKTWDGTKWVVVAVGEGANQVIKAGEWVAVCRPATAVGAATGAVVGGVTGSAVGTTIGASLATASCLASIGLSVGTLGATTLLSVGVCGSAIAAGSVTGAVIGTGVGTVVGGTSGAVIGNALDNETCELKE